jgi:hypothetical protein
VKYDLVVVPCSALKQDHACAAGDMYFGSYHRLCRRAADALQPDRVMILSALHGLIPLDQVIEPYDLRIGDPDCFTDGVRVAQQAEQLGLLQARQVVALGGKAYTSIIYSAFGALRQGALVHRPLAGTRGIGEQRARLSFIARTGRL